MTRGISLHIGLNRVNPDGYNGWDGQLSGCINDANAMLAIADSCGYQSTLLTDEQATAGQVIQAIGQAAQQLAAGDHFLLTYSGHGGQIPDVNGDEDDGLDETWALYDRMLVDDELYQMWSQFQAGVRIFMLSDSCHSGTVAKMVYYGQLPGAGSGRAYGGNGAARQPLFRAVPQPVERAAYEQHKAMYDTAQWLSTKGDRAAIDASIILISGCQDNQLSGDGEQNGIFTGTLLEVWNNGAFEGNYYAFWKAIMQQMPATQSPNYYKVGQDDPDFEGQKPFDLGSTTVSPVTTAAPAIQGPASWSVGDQPPLFQVTPGPGRYYIVELTTQPELFDITNHGDERSEDNFYGSWSDTPHLSAPSYTPPQAVWNRLTDAAEIIYYRIGTTISPTGWDEYTVSTGDADGADAPAIQILRQDRGYSLPLRPARAEMVAARMSPAKAPPVYLSHSPPAPRS